MNVSNVLFVEFPVHEKKIPKDQNGNIQIGRCSRTVSPFKVDFLINNFRLILDL
jgi:hypothetical protein